MNIKFKGEKLAINLTVHSQLSPSEEVKLKQALRHAVSVLNSKEFEAFVKGFSYEYTACTGALWWKRCRKVVVNNFNWNGDLSNTQVYNKIMTGSETLRPEPDNEVDIDLVIDRRNKRGVLGYTYPNSIKQWIYANFFARASYKEIAANLVHEYFHKLGFDHAFKYHHTRQFTVPYAGGYYVRDAKGYFDNK